MPRWTSWPATLTFCPTLKLWRVDNKLHTTNHSSAKSFLSLSKVLLCVFVHLRYFAINPSLHGMNKDDFFVVYIKDYAPKIEAFSHNGMNTWPNIPQDKETVSQLLEIWKLPNISQCEDWIGKWSRSTIKGYMKDIQKKALETPPGIRCLLLTCPRFVLSSHQHTMLRSYDLGLHKMMKSGNHFKIVNLLLTMLNFCINGPMLFWLPLKAMNLVMSSLWHLRT